MPYKINILPARGGSAYWRKTKITWKAGVLAAILLAAIFSFGNVSAQTVTELEKQRSAIEKKLTELNSQIQKQQQAIAAAQRSANTLKNQISIYDSQISSSELQIQAENTRIDDLNLQINELQQQIKKRGEEIIGYKKVLAQVIVELNELQHDSTLNIGLGSGNFSSFLDQLEYTESVQDKVHEIITNIKEIKKRLETQQADLKVALAKLVELRDGLQITQNALLSQRQGKEKLLSQTRGQEASYQRLLSTSKNQEADLLKEIQDLDNSIAAKLGKMTINPNKGALAYPMKGVLTQGYGNTGFTALGYNYHNGIDLAAPAGTPIYAAGNGTVVSCDTGEAAYGNWCAIKHPIQTSSGTRNVVALYAHMRSFKIRGGQTVNQGDLIGYEGNSGNTTRLLYGPERGYHLHFTIFDEKGFSIAQGSYSKIYGPYRVPYGYTYNPLTFLK